MIVRLTASKPGALTFNAAMFSPQKSNIKTENNELILSGISGDRDGVKGAVKFQSIVKVKNEGGQVIATDTSLNITNANAVTIFISIATNFVKYNDISADESYRCLPTLL
jgi:alpha-L-fucosidase 2